MRLPEVCIRHPIFASVLSIMAVLLGLIAFHKLDIQYFPEHTTHSASVNASIAGLAPILCRAMSPISWLLPHLD